MSAGNIPEIRHKALENWARSNGVDISERPENTLPAIYTNGNKYFGNIAGNESVCDKQPIIGTRRLCQCEGYSEDILSKECIASNFTGRFAEGYQWDGSKCTKNSCDHIYDNLLRSEVSPSDQYNPWKPTSSQTFGACVVCPDGYYPNSEHNRCDQLFCAENERVVGNACSPCEAGTWSTGGRDTTCTPCVDGKYSDSSTSGCVYCELGKYSHGGSWEYNPDTGTSGNVGATSCVQCPAGTYGDSTRTQCQQCESGKYQDEPGKTGCKGCWEAPGKNQASKSDGSNWGYTSPVGSTTAGGCGLVSCVSNNITPDQCRARYVVGGATGDVGSTAKCYYGGWRSGCTQKSR